MTNTACIFDLDGTLYPHNQAYKDACVMAVETSGNAVSGLFNLIDNYHAHNSAADFAKTHGLHETLWGLPNAQTKILEKARKNLSPHFLIPNPPLIQALEYAHEADIPLYLITHSEKKWVDQALHALKLDHLFAEQNRITRDNNLGSKRDTQSFDRFLKYFSIPKSTNIILFDDTAENKNAAENAGLEFSIVNKASGVSPEFLNAVTDTVIENRTRSTPDFDL